MRSARQIEHDKMIDGLDINGILDRYFGKADTFVLISPFDRSYYDKEPYDKNYPYGRYKLSKADADHAFEAEDTYGRKYLRRVYEERLSAEQKAALPSFEELCEEIKAECIAHEAKRKRGKLGEDESPFAEDLVCDGEVKYSKPADVFWHFYSCFGNMYCGEDNTCVMLEKLTSNTIVRPLDYELRKPPYSELLPHLISATPTFIAHCHSGLKKEFRFRFNEVTRAWLAEHYKFGPRTNNYGYLSESDGYAYGLENLTFFNGDNVLFYQCSHESMQYDHLERFDD